MSGPRVAAYTAEDLGLTGWVLHAYTTDGDDWIITEVLGYCTDWINRSEGIERRVLRGEMFSPGAIGPSSHIGNIERFAAVWHGDMDAWP